VLYLADGRVVAQGTHDELMAASTAYAELMQAFEHDRDDAAAGGSVERTALDAAGGGE
jgi:hypothetical protein